MYGVLLRAYSARTKRYFSENTLARSLIAGISLFVLMGVAFALYRFFVAGFRYLNTDAYFAEGVRLYVEELFLLVSSLLVSISAVVTGLSVLYRGRDEILLAVSPRYTMIPRLFAMRVFLTSLWPLLLTMVPFLLAIQKVFGMTYYEFGVAFFACILLVVISVFLPLCALLGVAHAQLLVYTRYHTFRPTLIRTLLLLTLFITLLFTPLVLRFVRIDLVDLFQAQNLESSLLGLGQIFSLFQGTPSTLVASLVHGITAHIDQVVPLGIGALIVLAVLSVALFVTLTKRHLVLWQVVHEGVGRGSDSHSQRLRLPFATINTPFRMIVLLEISRFFRDSRGILWFGFILVLWAFQLGANAILGHRLGGNFSGQDTFPVFLVLLRYLTVVYFSALFALRFAFPSHAISRKARYLLATSPIPFARVYLSKILFFGVLFSMIAILFAISNLLMVPIGSGHALYVTMVGFASFTMTCVALFIGVLNRNESSEDPEVLTTSGPGIFFVGFVVAYGGLGAYSLASYLSTHHLVPMILFSILSLVLIFTSIWYPVKKMNW